jgi:hypothetical protein
MAELGIGVLSRQCLNRRIAGIAEMSDEVAAWVAKRNSRKTAIHWQFTTADARIKLQHLYPIQADYIRKFFRKIPIIAEAELFY